MGSRSPLGTYIAQRPRIPPPHGRPRERDAGSAHEAGGLARETTYVGETVLHGTEAGRLVVGGTESSVRPCAWYLIFSVGDRNGAEETVLHLRDQAIIPGYYSPAVRSTASSTLAPSYFQWPSKSAPSSNPLAPVPSESWWPAP